MIHTGVGGPNGGAALANGGPNVQGNYKENGGEEAALPSPSGDGEWICSGTIEMQLSHGVGI